MKIESLGFSPLPHLDVGHSPYTKLYGHVFSTAYTSILLHFITMTVHQRVKLVFITILTQMLHERVIIQNDEVILKC